MKQLASWIPALIALALLIAPSVALADVPSPGQCDSCAVGGPGGTAGDAVGLGALVMLVTAAIARLRRPS